jgi:hypothetical protein
MSEEEKVNQTSVANVIFRTRATLHRQLSHGVCHQSATRQARDLEPDFSFLSSTLYTNTKMAGQAGQSSRLRASQASQTQNGSLKRKRYENIEEMFEAVDPEENERLSRQYRQLIQKADGKLTP